MNNSYIKRDQFDFIESVEYQVSFAHGPIANINPIQSFHFYDYIMSQHNESMGAYEVDFLDFDFLPFMQLQQQVDAAEMWMKGMADAAINNNVSIQLCMELPRYLIAEFPPKCLFLNCVTSVICFNLSNSLLSLMPVQVKMIFPMLAIGGTLP